MWKFGKSVFLVILTHFSIVMKYAVLKYAKDLTDAFNYFLQDAYMDLKTMGFLPWSEFLLGIAVRKSCTGIPLIMVVYLIFLTSGGILFCLGVIAMYPQFAFFPP